MEDRMIITGASAAFGPSLLALLGSLHANWPGHPNVIVYDIGLDETTRMELHRHGVCVREVPAFCDHWNRHFAWKIWCLHDAPAKQVLWLDAGACVLAPLDEAFIAVEKLGYFAVATHHPLTENASEAACRGCHLDPSFRNNKMTVAGCVMGFDKTGEAAPLIAEAMKVARIEECLAATHPRHRHDQALLSLLLYKYFSPLLLADAANYMGWTSPRQVPCQQVWVHRRRMRAEDMAELASRIGRRADSFVPAEPEEKKPATLKEYYWQTLHKINRRRAKAAGKVWVYDGVRDAALGGPGHGGRQCA